MSVARSARLSGASRSVAVWMRRYQGNESLRKMKFLSAHGERELTVAKRSWASFFEAQAQLKHQIAEKAEYDAKGVH